MNSNISFSGHVLSLINCNILCYEQSIDIGDIGDTGPVLSWNWIDTKFCIIEYH